MDEAVLHFDRAADSLEHPTVPYSQQAPGSGIWANNTREVIYYTAGADADGRPLDGSSTYRVDFSNDQDLGDGCTAFWSITPPEAPRLPRRRQPLNRWNLKNVLPLEKNDNGTLTIAFALKSLTAYRTPIGYRRRRAQASPPLVAATGPRRPCAQVNASHLSSRDKTKRGLSSWENCLSLQH